MNRRRGFTLVELVVVIAVIAILATLATLGLSRYLADGRDNRRTASVTTLSEALEKYYDKNGEYPSCAAMTASAATVVSVTFPGLDKSALVAPGASSSTTNSIQCGTTLTTSNGDFIEYVGDGSPDCSGSGSCLTYSLRYKSEADNTIKELDSRRATDIATSGSISNLSTSNVSFKSLTLNWTAVTNAASYSIQQATSADFVTGLTTISVPTNTANITGLTPGTTYYFRAQPVGGSQQGGWSNTANATSKVLGAPTITTVVINSSTQVTVNWTSSSNADVNTTYTLERASNASCTTTLQTYTGLTGNSSVVSGLTAGQTYYYRLKAVTTSTSPSYSGAYSNCQTASTDPPTGVSVTVNSSTQVTVNWSSVVGASSYKVYFGTTTDANTYSQAAASTSAVITTNITQGTKFYFKVVSIGPTAIESSGSSVVNGTTPIDAPAAFNITCSNNGVALTCDATPAVCPAGTSKFFFWRANGSDWVNGTAYGAVTYSLSYGQGVTLTAAVRCYKVNESVTTYGSYTWASNSGSFTRPGMNLSMSTGADGCSGGFCGRVVNAAWNNVCGAGSATIYAQQLSYTTSWTADSASSDSIRWKGGSGGGVLLSYYNVTIGCTSTSGSIYVNSAYKCSGCS